MITNGNLPRSVSERICVKANFNGYRRYCYTYMKLLQTTTPPKTHMEPSKLMVCRLCFPFPRAFFRFHVSFPGCIENSEHVKTTLLNSLQILEASELCDRLDRFIIKPICSMNGRFNYICHKDSRQMLVNIPYMEHMGRIDFGV